MVELEMSGKSSRTKGHDFEWQVVRDLNTAGIPAHRNLSESGGQADNGVDVFAGEYLIQCKRYRNYAPISKLAEVPPRPGMVPLLITKADRLPAVVVMRRHLTLNWQVNYDQLCAVWQLHD